MHYFQNTRRLLGGLPQTLMGLRPFSPLGDGSPRSSNLPTPGKILRAPTLISYGDRTFAAAGPRFWNSLPVQLCNLDITYELRTVQTS